MTTLSKFDPAAKTVHVFEAAGLGLAPFRFDHFTINTTQCDFCATHITNVFWVKSSDGKCFKVGCDCIEKTADAGLIKVVDAERRKIDRAKRQARAKFIWEALRAVEDDAAKMAHIDTLPHPMGWTRSNWSTGVRVEVPYTATKYFTYMMRMSGSAGAAKLYKWCVQNNIITPEKK